VAPQKAVGRGDLAMAHRRLYVGGLETTLEDIWQINTPESPFDRPGRYFFLTGATEPGVLVPLCDIGITGLSIGD